MRTIIETLDIRGASDEVVPNTFFRQYAVTNHLAVVYPGMGYSTLMPALYYPTRFLIERGADVLTVDYNYRRADVRQVPNAAQVHAFEAEVTAAFTTAMLQRSYQRVTLIGKSLGTHALGHLIATQALPDGRCVWLTPLLGNEQLRDQIRTHPQPSLFVIGTSDAAYSARYLAEAQEATQGSSIVIKGADHSLEVVGNMIASIAAQSQVIEALAEFLG